mmetsp:Transcript_97465/g.303563  ORF Transcript_97465/g.303563 Transcript_97465/m.303563 type:complete len:200 (+) Transcript_97465:234-833(+)
MRTGLNLPSPDGTENAEGLSGLKGKDGGSSRHAGNGTRRAPRPPAGRAAPRPRGPDGGWPCLPWAGTPSGATGHGGEGIPRHGRAHLHGELHLDVGLGNLPPPSALHLLASDEDALEQAVVVLLLPLEGEEQAPRADPTQVDASILQVVLKHPVVASRRLIQHGPHREPVSQLQRVTPLLESRVCTLDEGLYVLMHGVV